MRAVPYWWCVSIWLALAVSLPLAAEPEPRAQVEVFTPQGTGKTNKDAAWYYPEPKEAARQIRGFVAFWKGVQVVD